MTIETEEDLKSEGFLPIKKHSLKIQKCIGVCKPVLGRRKGLPVSFSIRMRLRSLEDRKEIRDRLCQASMIPALNSEESLVPWHRIQFLRMRIHKGDGFLIHEG